MFTPYQTAVLHVAVRGMSYDFSRLTNSGYLALVSVGGL